MRVRSVDWLLSLLLSSKAYKSPKDAAAFVLAEEDEVHVVFTNNMPCVRNIGRKSQLLNSPLSPHRRLRRLRLLQRYRRWRR